MERYPEGKEKLTGIGAEPWHFRYVGFPHSVIMMEKEMVLEEYIQFLKKNTSLDTPYHYGGNRVGVEIAYLAVDSLEAKRITIPEQVFCLSSGTNDGGSVISKWRV